MKKAKKVLFLTFYTVSLSAQMRVSNTKSDIIDPDMVVHKLEKHVSLLSNFNLKNKKRQMLRLRSEESIGLFQSAIEYQNPLVKLCAQKMGMSLSIDPVFETWHLYLKSYRGVDDLPFLHEYSIMLFSVYKGLLVEMFAVKPFRLSLVEINQLYERITALPIGDVLEALEQCYEQFMEIMDDYGFNSNISWRDWLMSYWWVSPVVIGSMVMSLFKTTTNVVHTPH